MTTQPTPEAQARELAERCEVTLHGNACGCHTCTEDKLRNIEIILRETGLIELLKDRAIIESGLRGDFKDNIRLCIWDEGEKEWRPTFERKDLDSAMQSTTTTDTTREGE